MKETIFVLLFVSLLNEAASATVVYAGTAGQLSNAVNNGTAGDTIMVAAGTYLMAADLAPKAGMTIKGAGITSTILKPASSWNPGTSGLPYDPVNTSVNTAAYFFNAGSNTHITISDMTMDGMKQLQGAVYGNGSNYLTVYNVYFHDYTFTGIRLYGAGNLVVHDCEFINMAIAGMDPEAGAVVFAYLTNAELYNNQFYYAAHGVYGSFGANGGNFFGYKGRQLRQSRIHHNTILVNFSVELPFEMDQDVEIDHNYMVGMISLPRTGDGGGTPPSGVAFHIHHNYTSAGQVLEYPRNAVELDHNLMDNTRFENSGLIAGWYDNSLYPGPTKVHDNLINNLGRAICDIGRYNNFQFYNNHVIGTNNAGAGSQCFIIATGASDLDRSTFVVKDNIFDFSAQARALFWQGLGAGFTAIENNTLTNVTDQGNYSNPSTTATRGPLAPLFFTCGAPLNQFCVNQWTVTSGACVNTGVDSPKGLSVSLFKVYPNPASQSAVISYRLTENSAVKISAFDVFGKEIIKVMDQAQSQGEHQMQLNTEKLPGGIYFIRATFMDTEVTQKLVLNKN